MAGVFDLIDPSLLGAPQAPIEKPGEFSKGLRRGGNFALSNLQNFAGAVSQGIAPEFSQNRYRAADEAMQDAAAPELAPAVQGLRDIGGVRQAGQWVAGKAGEMVPVLGALGGATLLGPSGLAGAALTGTAALAPLEIGDVVGRQRAEGRPVDLGTAAASGVGSAALQAALPAVARARLSGAGLRAPGGSLAIIPEQGVLTAGSEGVKQQGVELGRAPDWHAIGEAGLEGAILGAPFAAAHAVGSRAGAIRDTAGALKERAGEMYGAAKERIEPMVGTAKEKTGEALGAIKEKTGEALGAVKEKASEAADALGAAKTQFEGYELPDKLSEMFSSGTGKVRGWMDRVANREDTMSPPDELVGEGRTDADVAAAAAKDDESRGQQLTRWASDLAKEKLTPEQLEKLQTFQADVTNRAAQAGVAAMRKGKDAWDRASQAFSRFAGDVKEDMARRGAAKKSEDTSGLDRQILAEVTPILERARPDLFDGSWNGKPEDMQTLATGLRRLIRDISSGKQPSSDAIAALIDVTNGKLPDIVEAAYRGMGVGDTATTARVYESLNQIADQTKRHTSLVEALRSSLEPRYRHEVDGPMLQELATGLQRWARDGLGRADDPRAAYKNNQLKDLIQQYFGKNADAVFDAVERSLPKERVENQIERARPKLAEDDVGAEGDDTFTTVLSDQKMQLHTSKDGGLYTHPDFHPPDSKHKAAILQRVERIKTQNPELSPRIVKTSELGMDHPLVRNAYEKALARANKIAETQPDIDPARLAREYMAERAVIVTEHPDTPLSVTSENVNAMKFDRHNFEPTPENGGIKTGIMLKDGKGKEHELVLDAVKMIKAMKSRFGEEPWSPGDRNNKLRSAHLFMEAAAAVQDRFGKAFDIPDNTKLGKIDGQNITWGMLKGDAALGGAKDKGRRALDVRTEADAKYDRDTMYLVNLRKAVKAERELGVRSKSSDEYARITNERATEKAVEQTFIDEAQPNDITDVRDETRLGIDTERLTHGRKTKDDLSSGQIGETIPGTTRGARSSRTGRINELKAEYSGLAAKMEDGNATPADRVRARAVRSEMERLERMGDEASGRTEVDPFGQIHQATGYQETAPFRGGAWETAEPGKNDPAIFTDAGETRTGGAPALLGKSAERAAAPKAAEAAPKADWRATADAMLAKDDYSSLKSEAGVDRFLKAAEKRYGELKEARDKANAEGNGLPVQQRKALATLEDMFGERATRDLESFYDGIERSDTPPPGGPPSPKVVAAKKAALIEKARSGDKALLDELGTSTDAAGLRRALVALVEEQGHRKSKAVEQAITTANERLAELIRTNPDVAYGLQTRRYSLESTKIHEALERPGFGATHDSPFLHEGRFDWRANLGKSASASGAGARGAGTYLSTGDTTHKYYKRLFSGVINDRPGLGRGTSPTYHVSVDIPARQILDWDAAVDAQRPTVKLRLQQAARELGVTGETGGDFYKAISKQLGSDAKASDYLQKLGILGHTYEAADGRVGKAANYVIYDDSRITTNHVSFSREGVNADRSNVDQRAAVEEYIRTRLGPDIEVQWKLLSQMPHAGEFERVVSPMDPKAFQDVIRLSAHSLNPMSTAYHESLHAFFRHLTDAKMGSIMDVVNRAGESAPVMRQLREIMTKRGFSKEAMAQLADPEERSAYMYQFWAEGALKIGDQTKTVFGKIADFVRSVLGIWSNDQRAEHIMRYLHEGEYAKDRKGRDIDETLHRKLMADGHNKAIETAKKMVQPFLNLGESLAVAGGQRLRDTGIPALREIADLMKRHGGDVGDPGYVPAAGAEYRRRMNDLYGRLRGTSEAQIRAAVESLQSKSNAPIDALASPEARLAARGAKVTIRKALDDAFVYMQQRGVKVNDLGYGKDYFPRVYNPEYISRHQSEFKAVLDRHGIQDSDKILKRIIAGEGTEMTVETDKPGMQFLKPRILAKVPDSELAPFMERDGLRILNNYMQQATRRAEWAARFGDDSSRLHHLLTEAQRQGATPENIEAARKFVRSVDGTLGDSINPEARRLMGNLIVYQNLRLLPLGIFSSIVDPLGIVVRGGTVGDAFRAFKRGMKDMVKNFQSDTDLNKDAATKFAEDVGTIENMMLIRSLGANYSQGMVGETGRKINDALFRYNLMEQHNTSMRVAATEAAVMFLKRHASGDASPHSLRYLQELGLQKGDVKLDANGKVKVFESDGLDADAALKMRTAINRWVDGAVLRPDAVDVPFWMNDPHFALIAHLKRFTYSFQETILKRVVHEWENGNYTPAMTLVSYVPVMIASDMLKGMLQTGGGQPSYKEDWEMFDYVANGVERSGLYGSGQFLIDMLQDVKRGGLGVGALSGPTVEQLADAVRVMGGNAQFDNFAVRSMPANALYNQWFGASAPDPVFSE